MPGRPWWTPALLDAVTQSDPEGEQGPREAPASGDAPARPGTRGPPSRPAAARPAPCRSDAADAGGATPATMNVARAAGITDPLTAPPGGGAGSGGGAAAHDMCGDR